jgi:hypothetical protein
VLVPDLHLAVLRQNPNLLETINFSAGHLYLPARATKWSPGSASRRRQVCQGDWSSVTIRVFQPGRELSERATKWVEESLRPTQKDAVPAIEKKKLVRFPARLMTFAPLAAFVVGAG